MNFEQDIEVYAADVARFGAGEITPEVFKGLAARRGVYEQRESGTFMLRTRLTGGVVSVEQARGLAAFSRVFADGRVHVTTRQNIQLHGLRIADTPEVMRRLLGIGLLSIGGGANTVRTVVTCPYAGVCPAEQFDVTPYARAITDSLLLLAGSYTLPRKYKIACSGCRADCAFARATDLGCIAEVRNSVAGFRIYAGGGLGATSRPAEVLQEWIPASEIVRVAETVRRLFDRLGDRTNRARARLRYVVEKLGMQTFREIYAAELEVVRADGAIPASPVISKVTVPAACQVPDVESVTTTAGVLRVVRQNQAGLVTVPLHVPLGVVAADDLDMLAGIAGQYSDERGLRATRDQNLLIRSVPESGLSRLMESLQALKTVQIVPSVLEHFVTCTGATTCRLGICSSRGVGKAVAEAFEEAGLRDLLQGLIVHVSGCPNSCGQHPLAALGLSGAQLRHEGHTVPMYKVMLGGGDHEAGAVFAKSAGALPARAVPGALVALLQDYQAHRKDAESFLAYVERQGIPYFELLLKPYQAIPSFADNPGFYSDWTLS